MTNFNIGEKTKKAIINITVMLTVLTVFTACVFAAIDMGSTPSASAHGATNPYVGGGSYTASVNNNTPSNIDINIEKAEDSKEEEKEESKEETKEETEKETETEEKAENTPVQQPVQAPAQPQAPVQTPVQTPASSKPAEKPAESKPAETKPAEKPAESKPAETKPAEKPAQTTPPAQETTVCGLTQAQLNTINKYAIAKINELRASVGAGKLSSNGTLNSYAATRAQEASILWSHTRPNGGRGVDMISSDKYRGENLAKTVLASGFSGSDADLKAIADRLVTNWINSEGHYKNLVKGQYTQIGLQTYVVENNGRLYFYTAALFSN